MRQTISKEAENNTEKVQQFLQTIQATNKYMAETVMVEKEYTQVRQFCFNTDKLCTVRAMEGDCRKPDDYEALEDGDEDLVKYEYMASNCSPTCQICDLLILTNEEVEILNECTPDVETNVFQEGDLNKMFQRIVGELPFEDGAVVPDYKVNIISRPLSEEHIGSAMHELDFHVGPWILTLDNFLTDDECDRLVELGATSGYYKSLIENEDEDEEDEEEEEEDAYRTSTNAWCQDECYKDPIAQRVIQKIENTTGIPDSYSEYLQLLKYGKSILQNEPPSSPSLRFIWYCFIFQRYVIPAVPGQYYKEHHDWSYDTYHRKYHNPGPRLVTFFLYLNEVEEGGATRFTDIFADDTAIHIDVKPKKGTALVWPSVHDEDLNKLDERTYHAALSVEKGLKFGANAWLHLRDFKNDECDYEEMESITGRRKNVDEDEEWP